MLAGWGLRVSALYLLAGLIALGVAVATLALVVLVALAVRWVPRLMARHEVVRAEGRFRL